MKRQSPILKQWRAPAWRRQLKRERHPYLLTCEVCLERDEEGRPLLVGYGHSLSSSMKHCELLRLTFGNLRQRMAFTGWDSEKRRFVCESRRRWPDVFTGVYDREDPPRFICRRSRLPRPNLKPHYEIWRPSAPVRHLSAFAQRIPRTHP